jgi:hypothetical protein
VFSIRMTYFSMTPRRVVSALPLRNDCREVAPLVAGMVSGLHPVVEAYHSTTHGPQSAWTGEMSPEASSLVSTRRCFMRPVLTPDHRSQV